MKIRASLILILLLSSFFSIAQNPLNPDVQYIREGSKARAIASLFTFSLSSGYTFTNYKTELSDFAILKQPTNSYLTLGSQQNSSNIFGYDQWLGNPQRLEDIQRVSDDQFIHNDTLSMAYRGFGSGVPIQFSIHYTAIDRIRIGFGASQEFISFPEKMSMKGASTEITDISLASNKGVIRRYFVMLGAKIIDYGRYTIAADLQYGKVDYRKGFAQEGFESENMANLGLNFEYNLSIYSALFIRPAVESRSYKITLADIPTYTVNTPSYGIQFGLRFKYPAVKRCPISSCNVRYMHHHSGVEFRGVSIFRKQTLRYGEAYKQKSRYDN
ncbi:hypothetical protein [Peijinzhouia sedimentorum]